MINRQTINQVNAGSSRCVTVLMSTYNGEKYLRQQIDSIVNQNDVRVDLHIRDDGSTDRTMEILEQYESAFKDSIHVYRGCNLGATNSFLALVKGIPVQTQWYAFADQDDYWLQDKLSNALDALSTVDCQTGVLYASSAIICDEQLNYLKENSFEHLKMSVSAEFARHRLPGHTMVFDEYLIEQLRQIPTTMGFPHDHTLCLLAAICKSAFVFTTNSRVLHRRLKGSVTPGGNGLRKRLKHELALTLNSGKLNRKAMADYLLDNYRDLCRPDEIALLEAISKNDRSYLLQPDVLDCGLLFGNIETKISILLSRYSIN